MSAHATDLPAPHAVSRRAFLRLAGAAGLGAPFLASDLIARPPSRLLGHASFGAGGMAWEDIQQLVRTGQVRLEAVAEVDLKRAAAVRKAFPQARIYQDWRKLLDREARHIDSVSVSTPDHMHAPMAMSALQLGKNVYCQKPLTHDLWEARKLAEYAGARRGVTQMGIQIHATSFYRMAATLARAGAIGRIKEVHCWNSGSWGDAAARPDTVDPVPEEFDWDLWLGVCARRPFIGKEYYHPFYWRRRLDFGTGTLGDMGCHLLDPVFMALGLGAPNSVRSEGVPPNAWNWPVDAQVHYVFPGTAYTADPTLPLTWYDGARKPPPEVRALLEGDDLPGTGSLWVGTQGVLVLPHVARPMLYPDAKFKDLKLPEIAEKNHWGEYVDACRGQGRTTAGFNYSGPLTEAVLLGTIALRFPQATLHWDSRRLAFAEPGANPFIRRAYRAGWSVRGLG